MLRKSWLLVRSSLWFVPGLFVLAGVVAAIALVEVDIRLGDYLGLGDWRPFFGAGAEGARAMLTAIASSMITVAGVAFSVTIVTLSLASTQYTPRILRNFMRDPANQSVLGAFVGIYTYCLLVLRTVRGSSGSPDTFVPLLAVFFAVVLALVSIGCLIFFIHHTAASIQASYILEAITNETLASINTLFPQELGEQAEPTAASAEIASKEWHKISADEPGYIQCLDTEGIMEFAREQDVILHLQHTIGDFVLEQAPLVLVDRPLDLACAKALRALFVVGDFRTVEQDVGFGIRQIVDIALRALSPGVNDTSTAVSCLDYLSAILCRLVRRKIETPFRLDEGRLRVIAPVPRFEDHLAKALNEIRLCAAHNVTILLQMLCAIRRVALVSGENGRLRVLKQHAKLVSETADISVQAPYDRARINTEIEAVREALNIDANALPPIPVRGGNSLAVE